jgi:Protein of unknown function (DUF402)
MMSEMLMRHVAKGRVVMALPSIVVEQTAERLVTWIAPGTPIAYPLGRANGRLRPFEEWEVELRSWAGPGRLELTPAARRHSIRLFHEDEGSFLGWYVNLQAPLAESAFGFDTTDWQLDLWIEPDGDVHWKDEDDLEQAVDLRIMTAGEARAAREEADRVLEEWPFPTGWEDWRPDPGWAVPTLPEGWDVV